MATKLTKLRFLLQPKIAQNFSAQIRNKSGGSLPESLRRNYERFQRDDGVPIHLKGGVTDRLLLGITCLVLAIGMADTVYTIIRLDHKH